MNRTFRPRLEQLEQHITPSAVAPPGPTLPDGVELGGTTAPVVTDALDAITHGVALAFLVAQHWQNPDGPDQGGGNG